MLLVIIKVLALLFTIVVTVKSYLAFRQRQETFVMFLFWSATWLGIIAVAFYPDLITKLLGERRVGVGSFLGVSLVFVYFVVYRVYIKADRVERQLSELIREVSIGQVTGRAKKKKGLLTIKKNNKHGKN